MLKKACLIFAATVFGAATTIVVAGPAQASVYPCTNAWYRTWDYTNHVSAIGVTGQLQTPSSTPTGVAPGRPSAGDVVLINWSTGEFVQYGWYEGSAGALPYSSVPRVFFGESTPTGETLTAGPTLTAGSTHVFRIVKTAAGGYHMYLDGTYKLSNSYGKGSLPTPQIDGETDFLCTEMLAVAHRDPNPPNPTLYYGTGTPSSLTWNLFVDAYFQSSDAASTGAFASTAWNGQATFFGWGGG